ncbi:pyridoxamine 5'-phosphate oxidase [Tichowtungia aerotolerans]|uniref:Pyridoxamine 5'-phosphate oxidase n=2 Tax=Tichowtungia aerotolerans TaxID=2697043 RepID=A0A6P1M5T9_9BACT|nr:pyridoxamine 5'-phosphate oxidase [Tichowtungia aerotolerans]
MPQKNRVTLSPMDRPIHNETPFGPANAGIDPFALFEQWFKTAMETDPNNAAVMTLATAFNNRPSARMVLMKEHSPDGFVFYTNYESRKGSELAENPKSALVFWWPAQERQVRIEGHTTRISAEASDAYFATRPRDSQLSAWASAQSSEIDEPISLEAAKAKFKDDPIPRPCSWGGLQLVPERFEFWQGRTSRLHDRIAFIQKNGQWSPRRLAP